MSHFAVMVIGANPEQQLAPYHEFECTGHDDQYVQDVDITDEVRAEMNKENKTVAEVLGWWGLDDKIVEHDSLVNRGDAHKYGYAIVRQGELIKAVNRTNPNKKWDWYLLGGRFTGHFKAKPGVVTVVGRPGLMTDPAEAGRADSLLKRDVDMEGMRAEAESKARAKYKRFHAVIGDAPFPKSWATVREENAGDIEVARTAYHAQPAIQALTKDDDFRWEDRPQRFGVTEDQFAQTARDEALICFAVVKDGKWYERGEMGWWACVSNEKDRDEWNREFSKLLDSVPDDTLLSVYDCHI